MSSSNRSAEEILKEFESIPKLEMNPEDKRRMRRDLLIKQQDMNTDHRFHIQWSGILAGTIGVTIVVFGYFNVVENHTVLTTTHHHVITASNFSESNATQVNSPPHLSNSVSSTDKSVIKLLKQRTHFKAILPSFLPQGYGNYTARLDTVGGHQELSLDYRGTRKYQSFGITEFPYVVPKKIPTNSGPRPSNINVVTIDGTKVTVVNPHSQPQKYDFVKNGVLFQVVSSMNTSDDAMKFVKSLIKGGTTWN